MVNVPIRKSAAVAELIARIGSTSISVEVEDLLQMWKALDSSVVYFLNRDYMNATLHLEAIRRSPLTTKLINAQDRLEKILADSIPLRTGHPASTPTPIQPEKTPEKTPETGGEAVK